MVGATSSEDCLVYTEITNDFQLQTGNLKTDARVAQLIADCMWRLVIFSGVRVSFRTRLRYYRRSGIVPRVVNVHRCSRARTSRAIIITQKTPKALFDRIVVVEFPIYFARISRGVSGNKRSICKR